MCQSLCNDLYFLNQTLCRINVTLTQISEGKITELLLRDFGEVIINELIILELSKLKNRTEQNCQRTNEKNNQTTVQKNIRTILLVTKD